MADKLYPTPTRLKLLRAIANGQVLTDATRDDDEDVILLFPWAPTQWQDSERVTARVRELERAGWIEEHGLVEWRLTDAGRAVLEAHRGARGAGRRSDADVREPIAARLRRIADDTSFPAWLRAEATVAAHDVTKGCDIPTATDDLTVGAWLGVRAERRRHDPGGRPDDPSRLRAWPAQHEHDPKLGDQP